MTGAFLYFEDPTARRRRGSPHGIPTCPIERRDILMRPKVLAYYFPNWHVDRRNDDWFGQGWTEWDLLRSARPRFEGHRQPRVPALGELDESDPRAAEIQIDLAR